MREMPVNQVLNVPPTHDPVNHPKHYTQFPVEPIEILEHLAYNRGAACKYLIRAGLKDPDKELEDLEKSLWYVQREIARVKRGLS